MASIATEIAIEIAGRYTDADGVLDRERAGIAYQQAIFGPTRRNSMKARYKINVRYGEAKYEPPEYFTWSIDAIDPEIRSALRWAGVIPSDDPSMLPGVVECRLSNGGIISRITWSIPVSKPSLWDTLKAYIRSAFQGVNER